MLTVQRALLLVATASALVVPTLRHGNNEAPVTGDRSQALYSPSQVEYYMTDEEIAYVRPGFNIEVDSVQIPADGHPVVELSFYDDFEQPLDREGKVTPGELSINFILARYNASSYDFTAYTTRSVTSPITGDTAVQASSDSGGTWTDLGLGHARYRFGTAVPAGFDASATHTIGIYAERDLADIIGKAYYANVEYDFVPDGSEVTARWAAISNDQCNSCHQGLSAHGGSRRDVKLCVMCHSPQSSDPDTGNTVDFKVMVHKIHMGENLPSVEAGTPYQIIGYQQRAHDYSDVAFPQDIRHCASACHGVANPQSYIWYTEPSAEACGSCHDNVNFDTGENHPAGAQPDSACASCHLPDSGGEFDASIKAAHVIPVDSTQVAGLNMEILDVVDTVPGDTPTITFRLFNDDGSPVDPASLDSFNLLVGGPTTDYTQYFRESGKSATASGGAYLYTFSTPIPEDAMGTWTFSADAYRYVDVEKGLGVTEEVRDAAFNPVFYATVTDETAHARREVVDLDKCNKCHNPLALHGGQRFRIEECVICHNPEETDAEVRPADAGAPEAIHFKWMIHHIHRGEALTQDFTVYGYHGSINNYNDVRFPGDLRNCDACHVDGADEVPLPDGVLATNRPRDPYFGGEIPPTASACLSCHDSEIAAAHAYVNIAPFGEACASCHGADRDFSVDRVHAH